MTDDPRQAQRERERFAAAEVREYARGALAEVDHSDLTPAAGLVRDDDVRDLLTFAEQSYSRKRGPEDPEFWETSWARDRLERESNATATEAVRHGNVSTLEYLTGRPEYESDVSGLHALQQMETWLLDSEKCKVTYIADHMGRGKTDFVHLSAEVIEFRSRTRDDLENAKFACNIPTSDMPTIGGWDEFKEWVERGSIDSNRWMFIDEGSQMLTGYSDDREAVERLMSRLVKLARKYGVNIVIIGHTGMDLHADLRRLADYVEKPSLKTARVYLSVKRGEGAGHLFDLDGLPKARSYGFESDDEAVWSWDGALDSETGPELDEKTVRHMIAKRAATLAEQTELSQEKAAQVLSGPEIEIKQSMVSRAGRGEYNDELRELA